MELERQREAELEAAATAEAVAGQAFEDLCGLRESEPPLRRVLLEIEVGPCLSSTYTCPLPLSPDNVVSAAR